MTPEQLKASILQYAIQGKLVEQRVEEGTGEELYQQIQAEKQRLVQEKKIKKEKPLAEIAEDEIPFDIPESWKWVRWGNLSFSIQYGYNAPAKQAGRIKMVRISDIQNGKVIWDSVPFCDIRDEDLSTYLLAENDILFARTGGTVGKSYIVKEIPEEAIYAGYLIRTRYSDMLCPEYLYYFMQTHLYWIQLRNGTIATAQPNCNGQTLSKMILPLPPLAEQKRIVAKIEELLPLVERYAAAYEKLEQFNAKFPEDMKKSILQYAIQGKLVEQRAEEGTAEELYQQIQAEKQHLIAEKKIKKEKTLPEIAEDEVPFDIPESWKWCRLSDIIDVRDGTHDSPKYVPEGIPLITSKNLSNGIIDYGNVKYITQEDADKINARSMVEDDDILFAMIGSIGNPVLVKKDREFCIKNMALFKKFADTDIFMQYMYWFFFYAQYKLKKEASGGVQSFISLSRFREYLVPLPPFAEQKRIVAKIEELQPLCERLK